MKIAIIGTGISGMVAAYLLCREHEVVVFEANDYIGGHTHTRSVSCNGRTYAVDTGFIVFNERTYPNFVTLLDRLGVASAPTSMSFSVRCEAGGLEYGSASLNTLFSQRRNLMRPSFLRMLRDIIRFNRESKALLQTADDSLTLGAYLQAHGYSKPFIEHYVIPMGAAIWSADPQRFQQIPARFFVNFFNNHGMLSISDRPQWRVIRGGSSTYVAALTRPYRDQIRLRTPVQALQRSPDQVRVRAAGGVDERCDHAVIATHSDQALELLADPSPEETAVLSRIAYQPNDTVLHTDDALLPRQRRAWSSWNYYVPAQDQPGVAVTYHMNTLQNLQAPLQLCVTLNCRERIAADKIIHTQTYHHPVYTPAALAAQRQYNTINGVNRTSFCGAYWGYGFHEDGVNSALAACRPFGLSLAS